MADYENRAATLAAVIILSTAKHGGIALVNPYRIGRDVGELIRHARSLERLAVKACNIGLDERDERRRDRLADRCREIVDPYGFHVTTSGDPRGLVVKLVDRHLPADAQGDGFGRDGWGVY